MTGGVAALVGAAILGPRVGKYTMVNGKKKANAIPGHSLTLAALGVSYSGSAGTALTELPQQQPQQRKHIPDNYNSSGSRILRNHDIYMDKERQARRINDSERRLAGLVAITAGCANVNSFGALMIGLAAGIVVVIAVEVIDINIKIDDPVGAISVHGVCGALGTLLLVYSMLNRFVFYGGGAHL